MQKWHGIKHLLFGLTNTEVEPKADEIFVASHRDQSWTLAHMKKALTKQGKSMSPNILWNIARH